MISCVVFISIADQRGIKYKKFTVEGAKLADIKTQAKDLAQDVKKQFEDKEVDVIIWGSSEI